MASERRQRVIETNRSLRLVKNELESLLEKGVISDSAFEQIHALLPAESSLSSAAATPSHQTPNIPNVSASAAPNRASSPLPPTAALANLSVSPPPGPPSYNQSTGGAAAAPPLPGRHNPPPPPGKPVIGRARALYRYAASDARDCSFERDDTIDVHEHMNADWWMGRNTRTGSEGIFPRNYVEALPDAAAAVPPPPGPPPPPQTQQHDNEKGAAPGGWGGGGGSTPGPYASGGYAGYQPPPQPMYGGQQPGGAGYPAPPPQGSPYNAYAPPMAVAQQGSEGGQQKTDSTGMKIGKKLGNAAIFGAGATLGADLVNSIF